VAHAGGEGKEAGSDPGAEAGQAVGAASIEPELSLAGPKHRLDLLAQQAEGAESRLLVLSIGSREGGATGSHPGLELASRRALVGDHGVTVEGS
jgi:hypothetical protein